MLRFSGESGVKQQTTLQRTAVITKTLSTETVRVIRAPRDPALQLRFGLLVRNALSGRQYGVGELVGSGGFALSIGCAWLAGILCRANAC
jgi:hypothetical protein